MAECIANQIAAASNSTLNLRASSAGTRAAMGYPIHPEAAAVLKDLGFASSGFVARQLTARIVKDVDLVLTMTQAHRDVVLEQAPHLFRRTFTLPEAARLIVEFEPERLNDLAALRSTVGAAAAEIPDPMGKSAEVFAEVGSRIAELIPPVLGLCRRHAG